MSEALLCIEVLLPESDPELEEAIEGAIWGVGAPGVERQDDTTFTVLVEDPRPRPAGSVRWRIYLESPPDADAAADEFADALGDVAEVSHWTLDDLSFLTAWKDFFAPAQVSPRFMVHPPWDVPSVDLDVCRIEIDPGMAFGTGTHETTRLCLAAIDRLITRPGISVFDVGCGSGVLAIGAAKLGATPVDGMDHDPIAVSAATENCAINGVTVTIDDRPLSDHRGRYDLVVANILPHILVDLADDMVAHTHENTVLVLSGILTEQRDGVRSAYERCGLRSRREDQDGEWWSIEMVFQ